MTRKLWKALTCAALALALLCACGGKEMANLPGKPASGEALDVAGVLQEGTKARILEQNKALAPVGARMTVVTVDLLGGRTAAEYAAGLWDSWELDGQSKNGVLVLLAVGEGQYHLLQGSAIADALTDQTLADFAWTYLERDFAAGEYDVGVRKLCDGLNTWYQTHYAQELGEDLGEDLDENLGADPEDAPTPAESRTAGIPWLPIALAAAVLAVLLPLAFKLHSSRSRRRRYQGHRRRR